MDPYVIVGNGVAAVNATEAIREQDSETPIVIFTDQECAFYSRPSLYYIMLGRIEFEDAWGRPESFYEDMGVELYCGTRVTKLDPAAHTLEVEGYNTIGYSKALIASGTRGRVLPWAEQPVRGIVTLNTLTDVLNITDLLSESEGAVIVGGGLTSIELVEVSRHWGVRTTFVMRGPRFLDRQLTDDEAHLVHERLRMAGVDVLTEEEVVEVSGRNGRVSHVLTRSGAEIDCEIAGCAVGVVANAELCGAAGGETDRGIVVDGSMQTTLTDVYAAGDVAQLRGPNGKPLPTEMLWYVAAEMGRVAGANMAGGDASYHPRVFLNVSEFCGLDFCGVGSLLPGQPDVEETVVRDDRGSGSIRLVVRDGVLIGACFLGDIRLSDIARGLVASGARPCDLGADHPVRLLLDRGSP
jgi:nitrite reductase (NADH) large subunit